MRCVLIGSKQLSVNMLRMLIAQGVDLAAVFSRDDEPGMHVWHNDLGHESLKDVSLSHGIEVHEGLKVNSKEAKTLLKDYNVDLIFSCFWAEILDEEVLGIPRFGAFNLHTAYLPKYRGSRPIPWAIINNEPFCGLTIHKMATGVDNGPIIAQVKVDINENDSCKTVYDGVINAGSALFESTLPIFLDESFELFPQDEAQATYYPRGEPFGRQLMPHWDSDLKSRVKRAFDFPPFSGVIKAPENMGNDPALYSVEQNGNLSELSKLLGQDFDLHQFETSVDYRRAVRPAIQTCAGHGLKISIPTTKLMSAYKLLDALRSSKVAYVTTYPLNHETPIQQLQPFRHINGVLEIPVVAWDTSNELQSLTTRSKALVGDTSQDVYIGVSTSLKAEEADLPRLSFEDIAKHFNQRD